MSNPSVSQIKVGSTTYDIQDPEIRSRYYKHFHETYSPEFQDKSLNLHSNNTFTPTETVILDALLLGTDYDLTSDQTRGYFDVGKRANGSIYTALGLHVMDDQNSSFNGHNTIYFNMTADGTPSISFYPGPQIWRDALGVNLSAVHASTTSVTQMGSTDRYFSCPLDTTPLPQFRNDFEINSDGGIKILNPGAYLLLGHIFFEEIEGNSSIHTTISTIRNPAKAASTIIVNTQARVSVAQTSLATHLHLIQPTTSNTVVYLNGGNLTNGTGKISKGHLTIVRIG